MIIEELNKMLRKMDIKLSTKEIIRIKQPSRLLSILKKELLEYKSYGVLTENIDFEHIIKVPDSKVWFNGNRYAIGMSLIEQRDIENIVSTFKIYFTGKWKYLHAFINHKARYYRSR